MVQRKKCKARKTLKNDALDGKIGVDTAVNEPLKVCKTEKKVDQITTDRTVRSLGGNMHDSREDGRSFHSLPAYPIMEMLNIAVFLFSFLLNLNSIFSFLFSTGEND